MKKCCDMRGFLSFTVLWLISRKELSGQEIRRELERRRGSMPSPGTIYPVLKSLRQSGWIAEIKVDGKMKKYHITVEGRQEVGEAARRFVELFCDMKDEFRKYRLK